MTPPAVVVSMVKDVRPQAQSAPHARTTDLGTFAGIFVMALAIQILVGAYLTERGNFSDEAAHFMNGLLVRDYIRHGLGENPIAFAQSYYFNYPKIAPGMWPPLFHGLLGLVLLPGWPPETAALGLVGLSMAWTGWRLYKILRHLTTRLLSAVLGVMFMAAPAVINLSSAVMLDVVVAAFAIEAAFWLAKFFDSERWQHGAMFGLFASGACLTKGNGLAVLLMPALMLLFTRRFDLLRRSGLWIAAGIVLVVAAPFSIASFYFDATIGDFRVTNWADVAYRVRFYWDYLREQMGVLILAFATIGLLTGILARRSNANRDSWTMVASITSLLVATLLFHLLNPHKTVSGRYLTMAVAPLLGLVAVGFTTLLSLLRRRAWLGAGRIALVATLVIIGVLNTSAWAMRKPLGFRDVAAFIEARYHLASRRMLVVSDESGEGAFVAEVAARGPNPPAMVIRSSKLIASDDWGGHNFKLRFETPDALMRELEDLHVEFLIVDYSLEPSHNALWPITHDLLEAETDRLERIYAPSAARPIVLYQLKHQSPGPAKALDMAISSPFGQFLKH